MMELVTTPGKGTAGTTTSIPGYQIAGKTGTAQEPGGRCKCYAQGFYDVSFAGFAPIGNPRFTVYVVLRHPQGAASGSGSAGPVFRQIMSYLLQKYDVPPTGVAPTKLGVYW
jgi:cell division protein FtsI (penicillin-binding protein 3)